MSLFILLCACVWIVSLIISLKTGRLPLRGGEVFVREEMPTLYWTGFYVSLLACIFVIYISARDALPWLPKLFGSLWNTGACAIARTHCQPHN